MKKKNSLLIFPNLSNKLLCGRKVFVYFCKLVFKGINRKHAKEVVFLAVWKEIRQTWIHSAKFSAYYWQIRVLMKPLNTFSLFY